MTTWCVGGREGGNKGQKMNRHISRFVAPLPQFSTITTTTIATASSYFIFVSSFYPAPPPLPPLSHCRHPPSFFCCLFSLSITVLQLAHTKSFVCLFKIGLFLQLMFSTGWSSQSLVILPWSPLKTCMVCFSVAIMCFSYWLC